MNGQTRDVDQTVSFLQEHIGSKPEIGILTGTGLGDIATFVDPERCLRYQEIPNFPVSTVESHVGQLIFGTIQSRRVLVFQGRFHLYEGYSPAEVTFPIRVMQQLGIHTLILTNAAGGLNPTFREGDIMLVQDHINLTSQNPLIGPNHEGWGTRFPDMTAAYDPKLLGKAQKISAADGIPVTKGVYAGLAGPSLETPAETRFLRVIGADAVGFSTVMETIAAVHAGMRIVALSIITNLNDPDYPQPTTVESVITVANRTTPTLAKLVKKIVETMDEPD